MNQRSRGPVANPRPNVNISDGDAELTSRPKYASMPEFGVVVVESRHAANWSGPAWFDEDFNKFLFVLSGDVRLRTSEKVWDLPKDSLVHVVAHTRHSNADISAEPVVVYVIHYREQILPPKLTAELCRKSVTQWKLNGFRSDLARMLRQDLQQMLYEQVVRRDGWEALLISILIRLAVRALRLSGRQMAGPSEESSTNLPSLQRVADYVVSLETSFYRQQSLDEAAAKARLSRRQFTDLFRRVTGQSWRRHLHDLQLKHGARLLVETGKSITEIMFECGFDDLSHFYHSFKSAYGCSPQIYREKNSLKNDRPRFQSQPPESPRQ